VRRIGYEPDRVARSLATGHSNLIGVMVPNSTNPYYAEIIRGIEDAARAADYSVVLANGSYDAKLEENRMKEMMLLRVAGIIAAPAFTSARPPLNSFWQEFRRTNFPLVLVNRLLDPPIFHQVSADIVAGMRMAMKALASLGHHRVAYLFGTPATVPGRQRLAAFRRFARQFGFDRERSLIESGGLGVRGGYESCQRLWSRLNPKPSAIMTLSDAEAMGALRYLREQKVSVPRDVSVMGFDGFEAAEFSWVSLSTISTPMHEIGKHAVELLIEAIHHAPSRPHSIILPVSLKLRESVGSARR
jgi:LacI family transcriptional regulator